MHREDIQRLASEALSNALVLSAPVAAVALLVGMLIALFQALTQIQDGTLAFVPKLVAGCIVLVVFGGWMFNTLITFAQRAFSSGVLHH